MAFGNRLINTNAGGGGVYDITNLTYNSTMNGGIRTEGLNVSPDGTSIAAVGSGSTGSQALLYYGSMTNYELPPFYSGTTTLTELASAGLISRSLRISYNGLKMYVTAFWSTGWWVYEYNLSTAFDVTTRSYVTRLNLEPYRIGTVFNPYGIHISNDGVHLYVSDDDSGAARTLHFILSTPYSISTASLVETTGIRGAEISLNPDGTILFAGFESMNRVYQYNLSTPFYINTRDGGIFRSVLGSTGMSVVGGNLYVCKSTSASAVYRYLMT